MQPPYHPAFVHFPIALYCLGVLLTTGYIWRREADYERFGYWVFFLSFIAAIVASLVGLIDRGQLAFDDPRLAALDRHISGGVFFIIINGLILYSRFRWATILQTPRKWLYVALIGLGLLTITLTGWWGGELVYDLKIGIRD